MSFISIYNLNKLNFFGFRRINELIPAFSNESINWRLKIDPRVQKVSKIFRSLDIGS